MAAPRSLFSVVALCILAGCAVSRGQVHEHVDGEMCKHDTIQADRMKDPVYREEMWRFNQQFLETEKEIIRSFPHLRKRSGTCDTLFRVPVIWHVLYHNTDDRVPIERIDREMDAINKFFAGKNENRNKISETWQSVLGGDTCIRLEYAVKDGNGDPFNNGKAVIYKQTVLAQTTGATAQKCGTAGNKDVSETVMWTGDNSGRTDPFGNAFGPGADVVDQTKVLNVVVCPTLGGTTVGYATFPAATLPKHDGYTVVTRQVGVADGTGATGVHEVGHYFTLEHTFNGNNCNGNGDFVSDTPKTDKPLQSWAPNACPGLYPPGTAVTDATFQRCGNQVQSYNIMDYNADQCFAMFTKGQIARMTKVVTDPKNARRQLQFSEFLKPIPGQCARQCFQKVCGTDGCGGDCGTCPSGLSCLNNGANCGQAAPPNVDCANAIDLPNNQVPGFDGLISNIGAPNDFANACGTERDVLKAIWYKFIGGGKKLKISLCTSESDISNSKLDTAMAVFTGTCGNLQCFKYSDDVSEQECPLKLLSSINECFKLNVDYFLAIGTWANPGTGKFRMKITETGDCPCFKDCSNKQCGTDPNCPDDGSCGSCAAGKRCQDNQCVAAVPANDACANAISVAVGTSKQINNQGVTSDGQNFQGCNDITAPAKAVFFLSSGLQEGRKYEFTTCYEETKVDTILHLYSGSCESPSCVSANDDASDSTRCSTVTLDKCNGNALLIAISTYGGATGNIRFGITDKGEATSCDRKKRNIGDALETIMDVVVDNDPPGLTRDPGAAKRFFAHHNKTGEMQFVQYHSNGKAKRNAMRTYDPNHRHIHSDFERHFRAKRSDNENCGSAVDLSNGGCNGGDSLADGGECFVDGNTKGVGAQFSVWPLCFQTKSPGLFYKFTGTGNYLEIETCPTEDPIDGEFPLDTVIEVVTIKDDFLDTCQADSCIAVNVCADHKIKHIQRDMCMRNFTITNHNIVPSVDRMDDSELCEFDEYSSNLLICTTAAQQYFIFVQGFSADDTGRFELSIFDSGEECASQTPANRVCTGATEITTFPAEEQGDIRDSNSFRVTDCSFNVNSGAGDSQVLSNGLWYTFTPTTNSLFIISTCNDVTADFDTIIRIYQKDGANSCDTSLICVDQNDDADLECEENEFASEVELCATAGTTYYVLVEGWNQLDGEFQLDVILQEPCTPCVPGCPENAQCGDDGCGGFCGEGCFGNEQCVNNQCQCIPSCVDRECGDDGCGGTCGAACTGGDVCTAGQCGPAPANDDCNNAVNILDGQSGVGTFDGFNSDPAPACSDDLEDTLENPAVWYQHTGDGREWVVTTCTPVTSGQLDTVLFVYSGSCGALVCEATNDDQGEFAGPECDSNSFASRVVYRTERDETYFVLVRTYDPFIEGNQDFAISFASIPPPPQKLPICQQLGKRSSAIPHMCTAYVGANDAPSICSCV